MSKDEKTGLNATEIAALSFIEVRSVGTTGCILCGLCTEICTWDAPIIEGTGPYKKLVIRQERCRGCGVCVAACPARAIDMKVYSTDQIIETIQYVLSVDQDIQYVPAARETIRNAERVLSEVNRVLVHGPSDEHQTLDELLRILGMLVRRIQRRKEQLERSWGVPINESRQGN